MTTRKAACPCGPGGTESAEPPRRNGAISSEAIERLRQAAIPAPFKEIVWGLLARGSEPESPQRARGIEVPGAGGPKTATTHRSAAVRLALKHEPVYLTDLQLDLSCVSESTCGLRKIGSSIAGLVTNTYPPHDAQGEGHFDSEEENPPPEDSIKDDELEEIPEEEVRTVEKYIISIGFDVFGAARGVVVPGAQGLEPGEPSRVWDRSWPRGPPVGIDACLGH